MKLIVIAVVIIALLVIAFVIRNAFRRSDR